MKINSAGVTQQFQDKVCNTLLLGNPGGVYEDFYPALPPVVLGVIHGKLLRSRSLGKWSITLTKRHCIIILNIVVVFLYQPKQPKTLLEHLKLNGLFLRLFISSKQ